MNVGVPSPENTWDKIKEMLKCTSVLNVLEFLKNIERHHLTHYILMYKAVFPADISNDNSSKVSINPKRENFQITINTDYFIVLSFFHSFFFLACLLSFTFFRKIWK